MGPELVDQRSDCVSQLSSWKGLASRSLTTSPGTVAGTVRLVGRRSCHWDWLPPLLSRYRVQAPAMGASRRGKLGSVAAQQQQQQQLVRRRRRRGRGMAPCSGGVCMSGGLGEDGVEPVLERVGPWSKVKDGAERRPEEQVRLHSYFGYLDHNLD